MSKSRYGPLVKLKKKALDSAERSLIAANNALSAASDKLNKAYNELSRMKFPEKGSVGEFTQTTAIIRAQHQTIKDTQEELFNAEQRQLQMREHFKMAMIDYEKFKYLEVQEMNQMAKEIKYRESKMLDEIGTITYKREMI